MRGSLRNGLLVALLATVTTVFANPKEAAPPRVIAKDAPAGSERDFGPSNNYYSTIDGYGFIPDNSSALYEHGFSSGAYYCRSGNTVPRAAGQLIMPHGVRMNTFAVWGHDSAAASGSSARVRRACLPDFAAGFPVSDDLATVTTTNAFSGGDWYDFDTFASNTLVDNQSCTYAVIIEVGTAGCPFDQAVGIYKARVRWLRFIPAAPATATFNDVPTTAQFFREIEALVDTGITSGCSATDFCPDLAVTRRQMAAFLARALGLPPESMADPANP